MSTIYNLDFWIPVAIALFSTATSFTEMILRQRSDARTEKQMLEILNKLTHNIRKIGRKSGGKTKPSQQELNLKEQELALRQRRFNWQKTRDIGKTIKWLLDTMDSED